MSFTLNKNDRLFFKKNHNSVTVTIVNEIKGNFAELQNGDVVCLTSDEDGKFHGSKNSTYKLCRKNENN